MKKSNKYLIGLIITIILPAASLLIFSHFYLSNYNNIRNEFFILLPDSFPDTKEENEKILNDNITKESAENIQKYKNAFQLLENNGIKLELLDSDLKRDYYLQALRYLLNFDKKNMVDFPSELFRILFFVWLVIIITEIVVFILTKRKEAFKKT
jgi:uncharacterized membrane protein